MGRWRPRFFFFTQNQKTHPFKPTFITQSFIKPLNTSLYPVPINKVCYFRGFSSYPSAANPVFDNLDDEHKYAEEEEEEEVFVHHHDDEDDDELGKISVNAIFLSTRSEIAWREAKYAQIYEYLREEYEVTQRFRNLDYKLKFVDVTFSGLRDSFFENTKP